MQVQTVEKKGKTIDDAIQAALEELGCGLDEVEVEILEEGSKGLLGLIGSKPAAVKSIPQS
jgi:spoIIIJ-associated protein